MKPWIGNALGHDGHIGLVTQQALQHADHDAAGRVVAHEHALADGGFVGEQLLRERLRDDHLLRPAVVALVAVGGVVLPGHDQRPQPVDHACEPGIGRHQQRPGRGHQQRRGQHRAEDAAELEAARPFPTLAAVPAT